METFDGDFHLVMKIVDADLETLPIRLQSTS